MTTPDRVAMDASYVFLSYASVDRERALTIADRLEQAGIRVWLDRTSIAGGTSWGREIVEGIEHCAALVILCSTAAMQSRNVRQEIQLAWRYERPYVPLLLEPVEFPQDVQYFLEGCQWVDLLDQPADVWLPVLLKALGRAGITGPLPATTAGPEAARAPGTSAEATSATHTDAGRSTAAERGRALVGRATELTACRAALDRAVAGDGALLMLVGEPGIGKTRLAQELAAEAVEGGARVLWGRCWEGEGAPAFWPWMQALGSHARGQEPAALQRALGPAAAEIAQLVPEVRALLPDLPVPVQSEPEAARFRLFGGISAFLTGLARQQPLVLILDDLHWADKPSLLLLQFLAQELAESRILVLGTYRDTDLDRRHPLAEALTSLRREPVFARIPLAGLSESEVQALLETRAGGRLDAGGRALAEAIHRETEGNPFFIGETLRHLAETGVIQQQDGRWRLSGTSIAALGIPEGVRQVIGRRLSRLSERCNQLLAIAAVIGREFDADILERVSGEAADTVDEALGEAAGAAVVTELPGAGARYRFSHALIRETLAQELPTRRRLRLHAAVGAALEGHYGTRADQHAAELAYHFVEAGGSGTAAKALTYSMRAAEQAEAATAWEEAARHYEQALALLAEENAAAVGADEAALLTALGRCERDAGQTRAGWRALMRAITLYRERDDPLGIATATAEALRINAPPERNRALAEAALAALGGRDPHLEAQLLVEQVRVGHPDEATVLARAEELVARHGFADIAARLLFARAARADEVGRLSESRDLYYAAYEGLVGAGRTTEAAGSLHQWAGATADIGDLDAGERALTEALAYARRVHTRTAEVVLTGHLAAVALVRCQFDRVEPLLEQIEGETFAVDLLRSTRAEQAGELERALALMPEPAQAGAFPPFLAGVHAARARTRFNAGDLEGARTELAALVVAARLMTSAASMLGNVHSITSLDDYLPALDEALVQETYDWFVAQSEQRFSAVTGYGLDHLRGALALRLDRIEEAEAHYRTGLAWAERERCPVEQGRCLQGLAEIALRRSQTAQARAYLDRAAALFEQHGAVLYLRQVQQARETLRA